MTRAMVAIPRTRIVLGLTPDEADRLAVELAKVQEWLYDPGTGGFMEFDPDSVRESIRASLVAAMPAHEVEVGPFEIDVNPVTNAEWSRYVAETGARPAGTRGPAQHFVTGISWRDARAYAHHHQLDLPTEAEWECAARSGRSFWPWGDAYFPQGEIAFAPPFDEPYAVGTRRKVESARGVHDLIGTFGDLCSDLFAPYPGADRAAWDRLFPNTAGQRMLRGGITPDQNATCVSRRGVPENEPRSHVKFRCVRR